ncbi:MAG: hypothetical protein PVH34_06570, partial [Syntrophobacterales bacterium]
SNDLHPAQFSPHCSRFVTIDDLHFAHKKSPHHLVRFLPYLVMKSQIDHKEHKAHKGSRYIRDEKNIRHDRTSHISHFTSVISL